MYENKLIPGFRFHPTDVELVMHHLKRKVEGKKLGHVIDELDIYEYAPWDLRGKSSLNFEDLVWYFLCPRGKKCASGKKMKRATKFGCWKATGTDRPITHKARIVGMRKTLIFHEHKDRGRAHRTDWVMHEFRLEDKELTDKGIHQDSYVICKIFEKEGRGPRNGAQYGKPYDEKYWDEDRDEVDNPGQANNAEGEIFESWEELHRFLELHKDGHAFSCGEKVEYTTNEVLFMDDMLE